MALEKKKLNNITLVAVATKEVEETLKALRYSSKDIDFSEVLLISNFNPDPNASDFRHIFIRPFKDVGEWGHFIVFDLYRHIKTDFILLIHADGFIVNPQQWGDEFLEYDYIGSPWPMPRDNFSYRDYLGNVIRVGNSVSIRSKKLLEMPSKLKLDWESGDLSFFHEDGFICVQHRHTLEANGLKFAPLKLAARFGREVTIPENRDIDPFVFHKWSGKNSSYPRFTKRPSLLQLAKKFLKYVKAH